VHFGEKKWHDCLRFLRSFVHRNWTKVGCGHHFSSFILNDNILWIAFLNFPVLSIHPNRSKKAKNIKGASIRKDHKKVKVKQKILYVKVKTLYKSVSFVEQNKSYTKYYFTLDIYSITPQYLHHSLDTYRSTETFERNDLQ